MVEAQMPRVTRAFRIDDRLLDALDRLSDKSNVSANRYLENLLMSHAKQLGAMPIDAEPLGDNRGGRRSGSGKKSSKVTNESEVGESESDSPT